MVEAVRILGLAVLALTHGDHVVDLDTFEVGSAGDERVDEVERLPASVREDDAVAGLDHIDGLGRGRDLGSVVGLPDHPITPSVCR